MTGAAALLAGIAGLAAAAAGSDPNEHRFSIRADLTSAREIDEVLARVAEPVEARLPDAVEPPAFLAKLCGNRAPSQYEVVTRVEDGVTARFVSYRPCLRQRPNLTAKVTPGDTLEAIAVRFGMRASSVDALQVKGRAGDSKEGVKSTLSPGDLVTAEKAPAWTTITTRSAEITDRPALVGLIAKAIGCGSEEQEACLAKRSILIVEEKPAHHHRAPEPPPPAEPAGPGGLSHAVSPAERGAILWRASSHASAAPLLAAAALQPFPPATPDTAPVDSRQWPYDADLVARILAEDAGDGTAAAKVFIGVAENGLGDKYGRPLGIGAFVGTTADYPVANGEDDDLNSYVDDWIGAGVLRGEDELMPSGDVSLCPAPGQVYSGWQAGRLQRMSHGSVVASIASGGPLAANAALSPVLPRLVFFRMAKKVCGDADDDGSGEREAIAAVEYLVLRQARVLNLSFFAEGVAGQVLRDRLINLMRYDPPLLVLPAGNYISANLDETGDCPACLGNPTKYSDLARLTLVVGAATRERRIADYSGYGVQTVKLYAPGEPSGSVNLAGQPADSLQAATSFAAPRVSFAAGLVQTLGIQEIPKVRSRLLLSTWPLHPDSRPSADGTGGILDLVKAAAVRHHAVEVVQPDATGALVRRTLVGKIVGGLQGICPGFGITEAAAHAIRFGEADADGWRQAHITYRQVDPTTREPRTRTERCRSTGALQLEAIRDGRQDLNLADVRLILFKGIYP